MPSIFRCLKLLTYRLNLIWICNGKSDMDDECASRRAWSLVWLPNENYGSLLKKCDEWTGYKTFAFTEGYRVPFIILILTLRYGNELPSSTWRCISSLHINLSMFILPGKLFLSKNCMKHYSIENCLHTNFVFYITPTIACNYLVLNIKTGSYPYISSFGIT